MTGLLNNAVRSRPPGSCGDLRERSMRIGQLHRQGALSILAGEVHGLKLAARAWRFDAVESLAHTLEADLASTGAAALVGVSVDRMGDAIECDDNGPAAVEAMRSGGRRAGRGWDSRDGSRGAP